MIYEILWTLIVICIYYFLFVQSLPHDDNPSSPDKHYLNPYMFQIIPPNEIRVGGQVWQIPQLPSKYQWLHHKIIEKNGCLGKKDGEFIPASGESVRSYIEKHTPFMAPHKGTPFHDPCQVRLDHFFECQNQTEFKLYYCPPGTHFDKMSSCVSYDVCKNRPDGYRYSVPDLPKNQFYECQNARAQFQMCPKGEFFDRVTDKCIPPNDPCEILPDRHIIPIDRNSYIVCENATSRKRYCNRDEYFHPIKRICTSNVCENNQHGLVPRFKEETYWKFGYAYMVCDQGLAIREGHCLSASINNVVNSRHDFYYTLPQRLVYENGQCETPKLCVNVTPRSKYIPGNKFRTSLQNYQHSRIFDQLYAYQCGVNQKPEKVVLPPGQMLSLETGEVESCHGKNQKIPVLGNEHAYFNCQNQTTETCGRVNVFDYGSQNCIPVDDHFHTFENLSLFKVDGLDPTNYWFPHRSFRHTPDLSCGPHQVFSTAYNVCTDSDCKHYDFLSQLPGKHLYITNDYLCREQQGQIVKEPYVKPDVAMNLEFWQQKFVYGLPSGYCKRGTTKLYSADFFLNSVLFPTCSADGNRESPFIICPSKDTHKIQSTPSLCYPKDNIYWRYLENDGNVHTFYKLEIHKIEILNDETLVQMWDYDKKGQHQEHSAEYSAGTQIDVYNINTNKNTFNIQVNKQVKLYMDIIPTNNPHYFIHWDGKMSYHNIGEDRVKYKFKRQFIMEKFKVGQSLTGFM